MKNIKSHFKFNKQERSGIFFLLLIIVVLQVGYFVFKSFSMEGAEGTLSVDKVTQTKIDALKERALRKDSVKIYPFNPNFITDYKGYALGMSMQEIDRLHIFRAQNKFANSQEEFQKVTQISDSLLDAISPYFKFPEWTQKNNKRSPVGNKKYSVGANSKLSKRRSPPPASEERVRTEGKRFGQADLNTATAQDLKQINGIGEKLSARIIKFRDRLGGFLVDGQLNDVYGLEPEVVERALKRFHVLQKPKIEKININTASAEEISKLVYLQKKVAYRIVNYRNDKGTIDSFDELLKIEDFPSEKIDRIALYLSL